SITGVRGMTHGQVASPLESIPEVDGSPVFTLGVLAEWGERAYAKGQMANVTLESPNLSIRGVLWDQTLKSLRSGAGIPGVGSIVAVSGRVTVRSRDVEDEEGNVIETVVTKELMISQL